MERDVHENARHQIGSLIRFTRVSGIILLAALCCSNAFGQCVVLLHGLARTSASMDSLAEAFADEGFDVVNVDYPSRQHPIEALAPIAVHKGLGGCPPESTVHFVTHSLGGILVRYYLAERSLPRLGRVVMLAPPNQGSEVVDTLREMPGFRLLNGPAGDQLGTGADSLPRALGPVDFELGVIAGSSTFNLILSLYLPNPDDGKVSVASTRVDGMNDFIVLPYTHTFMMQAPEVARQAIAFIRHGEFSRSYR
jgi:pimeloyl-ACP methyl ester carboxylesterase